MSVFALYSYYMSTFKRFGVVLGVGAVLLPAVLVLAQDQYGNAGNMRSRTIQIRNARPEYAPPIGRQAPNYSTTTPQKKRVDFEAQREQLKNEVEMRASSTRAYLQSVRQQAEVKAKQQREKVQQKLSELRDIKKQKLAQQIVNQFDHINQVWTDHFTKVLDQDDAILQKIQVRANKAAANGKDVAAVNVAIQTAKTAIENARTAVIAQAKKTYTADTSTVTGTTASTTPGGDAQLMHGLQSAFKAVRDQLFKDLFVLRDGAVKDARTAVQNALQALRRVPGVDEEPSEHTASSTPPAGTSTNQ